MTNITDLSLSPPPSAGPDIDTPEEKKKKRELELAAAAAKEAEERERQEQEQLVTMAAALRINNSSPPMQRSHTHSAGVDQSDRGSGGDYVTGYRTRQEAAAPQAQRHLPYHGEWWVSKKTLSDT